MKLRESTYSLALYNTEITKTEQHSDINKALLITKVQISLLQIKDVYKSFVTALLTLTSKALL